MSDNTTVSEPTSANSQNSTTQPFRSAQPSIAEPAYVEQVTPTETTIGTLIDKHTPTIDEYRVDKGAYANEYFEIGTPYDYLPSDMQNKLDTIDDYVVNTLEEKGLKPSLTNYDKVITELKVNNMAGDEELSTNELIDRIYGYASNFIKMEGLDEIRERVTQSMRKLKTSKAMDKMVLREIGKHII